LPAKKKRRGLSDEDLQGLKQAGEWMRSVRVSAGLSQNQLLARLPTKKSNMFVSQMENGQTRLIPQYYEAWAQAVGVDAKEVARRMIGYYTPFLYEPLFGEAFVPGQGAQAEDTPEERRKDAPEPGARVAVRA
jgi:transcriptional regulator with XRE-family HTH domain